MTLFKHFKLNNYSFKKSNISISNALITRIFINTYYLWSLNSTPEALINISIFYIWTLLKIELLPPSIVQSSDTLTHFFFI